MRTSHLLAFLLLAVTGTPAAAQGFDVTLFLGRAYPISDERLTLRPSTPSTGGIDVAVAGEPELRTDGGLVVGGAVAFELGVLAIEGRLDATEVGFDLSGARYDLRATEPPFEGLTGSATVGDGRFDADRLRLLSLNLRLRTPGPVGLVASGGLSYLPDVTITGSVPVALQLPGFSILAGVEPRLRLLAVPGEPTHRFGINGGAGLRLGGRRLALMAEARVFYFREFELRFGLDGAPVLVSQVLERIAPVRFEPVFVNAQAGLVLRF